MVKTYLLDLLKDHLGNQPSNRWCYSFLDKLRGYRDPTGSEKKKITNKAKKLVDTYHVDGSVDHLTRFVS
jgi:hypothetical protein